MIEPKFKCPHCDKIYKYPHYLKAHLKSKHPEDKITNICTISEIIEDLNREGRQIKDVLIVEEDQLLIDAPDLDIQLLNYFSDKSLESFTIDPNDIGLLQIAYEEKLGLYFDSNCNQQVKNVFKQLYRLMHRTYPVVFKNIKIEVPTAENNRSVTTTKDK